MLGKRRRGDQECGPVPQEVIHEPALDDKQPTKVFSKQRKSQCSEFQKILKQWLHIPFPLFAYLCTECFQIGQQLGSCLGLRSGNEVGEKLAGHWPSSPVPSLLSERVGLAPHSSPGAQNHSCSHEPSWAEGPLEACLSPISWTGVKGRETLLWFMSPQDANGSV